jgi:hypothetical protein
MAVTIHETPLFLEYFMQFMNIDPLLFNSIDISQCVYTEEGHCNFFWDQYNTGRQMYNREQLAECLCSAYDRVSNYLGVKPTLQWECDEIIIEPHWFYHNASIPVKEMLLRTRWNNIQEFGQRLLKKEETVTLTYETVALNDFFSYADFTTTVPENHNVCDIRAYTGEYEIGPIKLLSYDEDTRIATFRIASWNLVKPELYLKRSWGVMKKVTCQTVNFLTEIDVYYDMVDPCKPAVEIIYAENHKCSGNCKFDTQPGCARLIDSCNGYFTIYPQKYDENGCAVDGSDYCGGCPYKIKVYYRAGCHKECTNKCDSSCHCKQLLDIVSMLAAGCLDEYPLCHCECMSANITKWQTNTALIPKDGDRWNIAASIRNELIGGFGTKLGEIEALVRLNQIANSEQFCTRE